MICIIQTASLSFFTNKNSRGKKAMGGWEIKKSKLGQQKNMKTISSFIKHIGSENK